MFSIRSSILRIGFHIKPYFNARLKETLSSIKIKKDERSQPPISGYEYYQERLKYVKDCKEKGYNLYPNKFKVSHSLQEFDDSFEYLNQNETDATIVSVSGRISIKRAASKKLHFIDIIDNGTKLQIVANLKNYMNEDLFFDDIKYLSRGDIIGIEGQPYKTKAGQLSIRANKITVLAPCLHILPSPHDKLKNIELLRRSRYLDLLTNDSSRNRFMLRTKIITYIRNFLTDRDFMEVETPILSSVPGGAAAQPFETHHNALDLNLYLRVAPELYLKMLIVGGFNKVFEIGRQFRNEGVDSSHNPEFTACEFYSTYTDYKDLRLLTEKLLSEMVYKIFSSHTILYGDLNINFQPPFQTLSFMDSIEKALDMKLPSPQTLHTVKAKSALLDICKQKDILVEKSTSTSKLLDKLFEFAVEPMCDQPTFIIDHPKIMSPLAKDHRVSEGLTERFELFIARKEICNAYTELNDPVEQRLRFEQEKDMATDSEYQVADENFCTALEHGMPPTAGWGLGIDRLVMILTNSPSISDVILFPTMKPDKIGKYRIKKMSTEGD